jgi:hypothetical protein
MGILLGKAMMAWKLVWVAHNASASLDGENTGIGPEKSESPQRCHNRVPLSYFLDRQ